MHTGFAKWTREDVMRYLWQLQLPDPSGCYGSWRAWRGSRLLSALCHSKQRIESVVGVVSGAMHHGRVIEDARCGRPVTSEFVSVEPAASLTSPAIAFKSTLSQAARPRSGVSYYERSAHHTFPDAHTWGYP